jgi:hypothetical protein
MQIFLPLLFALACGPAPATDDAPDAAVGPDVGADTEVDDSSRPCSAVEAELSFEAQSAAACASDADCVAWQTPLCSGPAACWAPVHAGQVERLDGLAATLTQNCELGTCDCADAPEVGCAAGRCRVVEPGCAYVCARACPCAVDDDGCDLPMCQPGTCDAAVDCASLEEPDCDGSWACAAATCTFVCEPPACGYTCDLSCRCAVDDEGCDLPECDLGCEEPAVCEDLPHAPCEGAWTCEDNTCSWRCTDTVCGSIADDLETAREEIGRCEEGDVCKSADNQLCGNVGGCYIFYRDDADFESVRQLERDYRAAMCFRPFCDHCAPPPPADCVNERCAAAP